jgi:hypothetical protein
MHPKVVLLLACLAPGAGHLALGRWNRGLGFALFAAFFAALTWKFAPPDRSLIGHAAGGLFVWAISIPDAYKSAVLRQQLRAQAA